MSDGPGPVPLSQEQQATMADLIELIERARAARDLGDLWRLPGEGDAAFAARLLRARLCRWCRADHYRRQHDSEGGEVRCTRCGEPLDQERTGPTLRPWTPVVGPEMDMSSGPGEAPYYYEIERDDAVALQLIPAMVRRDCEARVDALAGETGGGLYMSRWTAEALNAIAADVADRWNAGLCEWLGLPDVVRVVTVSVIASATMRSYAFDVSLAEELLTSSVADSAPYVVEIDDRGVPYLRGTGQITAVEVHVEITT